MKKLEEYKFAEIIDLKREDFDSALAVSAMNAGTLESLRKLLSLQYEQMQGQIKALSELASNEEVEVTEREKAVKVIEQMYYVMLSMEYKATAIYEKVKLSQESLSKDTFDKSLPM